MVSALLSEACRVTQSPYSNLAFEDAAELKQGECNGCGGQPQRSSYVDKCVMTYRYKGGVYVGKKPLQECKVPRRASAHPTKTPFCHCGTTLCHANPDAMAIVSPLRGGPLQGGFSLLNKTKKKKKKIRTKIKNKEKTQQFVCFIVCCFWFFVIGFFVFCFVLFCFFSRVPEDSDANCLY